MTPSQTSLEIFHFAPRAADRGLPACSPVTPSAQGGRNWHQQDRHRRRHLCGEPQLRQSVWFVSRRQRLAERHGRPIRPNCDRDGSLLKELPPVWGGLTGEGRHAAGDRSADRASAEQALRHRRSERLQHPAQRHHARSLASVLSEPDADRRRQERQVRRLRRFRRDWSWAITTAASCRCGTSPRNTRWPIISSRAAFGGSFLNHFWLICACVPVYPDADTSPAKGLIAAVDPDGVSLTLAPDSPKSALDGVPKFVNNGQLTPDFYAINTMQPPYQPSANQAGGRRRSCTCRSERSEHAAAATRDRRSATF